MNKFLIKITVTTLLLAIFTMTSGFCFQDLIGFVGKIKVAHAATVETQIVDTDVCGEVQVVHPVKPVVPKTTPHNSVLPCCIDGGHSDVTTIAPVLESVKVAPIILSVIEYLPQVIIKTVAYRSPLISPPELSSVKTTILRL